MWSFYPYQGIYDAIYNGTCDVLSNPAFGRFQQLDCIDPRVPWLEGHVHILRFAVDSAGLQECRQDPDLLNGRSASRDTEQPGTAHKRPDRLDHRMIRWIDLTWSVHHHSNNCIAVTVTLSNSIYRCTLRRDNPIASSPLLSSPQQPHQPSPSGKM